MCHIFLGPQSGIPGDKKKKSQASNAILNNITTIKPEYIAYVCLQVCPHLPLLFCFKNPIGTVCNIFDESMVQKGWNIWLSRQLWLCHSPPQNDSRHGVEGWTIEMVEQVSIIHLKGSCLTVQKGNFWGWEWLSYQRHIDSQLGKWGFRFAFEYHGKITCTSRGLSCWGCACACVGSVPPCFKFVEQCCIYAP